MSEEQRKASTARVNEAWREKVAAMSEEQRETAMARANEARRRSGREQFLPPQLLAMAKAVNPRDPGRRTYEAGHAWTPCVRAYNERARMTVGWEVIEDETKAANSLHARCAREKAR